MSVDDAKRRLAESVLNAPLAIVADDDDDDDPRDDEDDGGAAEDRDGGPDRPRPKRFELPDDCPVRPLGIQGDVCFYLDAQSQLQAVKARDHGRTRIALLFGRSMHYLWNTWPSFNRKGVQVSWASELAYEALMARAAAIGVWDPLKHTWGRGGWRSKRGELVFHCGNGVVVGPQATGNEAPQAAMGAWRVAPPGLFGRQVLPADSPGTRPADEPMGNHRFWSLLELLKLWFWRRGELDAHLLLGWMACARLGGALAWRPAVWVTGEADTGKSTLQRLIKMLLGEDLIDLSDATAAALWQELGYGTLPVALDEAEAEADNRKMDRIVRFMRQASSGGKVGRGGQDHKGAQFVARSCFLYSSILMPPLQSQDLRRLALLELQSIPTGTNPPKIDPDEMETLGRGMMRRLLDQWPRFDLTLDAYRAALVRVGHSGGGADQFGTLLAAADLMLYDVAPDEERCDGWAAELHAGRLSELTEKRPDWAQCLSYLIQRMPPSFKGGQQHSIAHLIRTAAGQYSQIDSQVEKDANHTLGYYGLRVLTTFTEGREGYRKPGAKVLAVASSHGGLATLFADSRWQQVPGATAVWHQTLRRAPGVVAGKSTRTFGGAASRYLKVPMDLVLDPTAIDSDDEDIEADAPAPESVS